METPLRNRDGMSLDHQVTDDVSRAHLTARDRPGRRMTRESAQGGSVSMSRRADRPAPEALDSPPRETRLHALPPGPQVRHRDKMTRFL